jgi:hypothetical protein
MDDDIHRTLSGRASVETRILGGYSIDVKDQNSSWTKSRSMISIINCADSP